MYKVSIADQVFDIEFDESNKGVLSVNNKTLEWDVIKLGKDNFHIIHNNKSYNAQVLEASKESKSFKFRVNNNVYDLKVKDRYDELLAELGINSGNGAKVHQVKAAMPGKVLEVNVKAGDKVKSGENLIVLEAMKMENIIKSPEDGTIKSCEVKVGATVNKNQLLITFKQQK